MCRQVHARSHTETPGRLTHMLFTADCNRVGMRCWAIIRMLSHILITTLQLRLGATVLATAFHDFAQLWSWNCSHSRNLYFAGCTFKFVHWVFFFFCFVYVPTSRLPSLVGRRCRNVTSLGNQMGGFALISIPVFILFIFFLSCFSSAFAFIHLGLWLW